MTREFTLNGSHVLAILAGFFLVIIAANAVFLTFAIRSFPGVVTEEPYLEGIAYNERLEENAAQAMLGWTAEITELERGPDGLQVRLAIRDREGRPVQGLSLAGVLRRPASDTQDQPLSFESDGRDAYMARAGQVGPGVWTLDATAISPGGERFRMQSRVVIE